MKKNNRKDSDLTLNTQLMSVKGKGYFKRKQGFKGTCRICSKYGHKVVDCWENDKNERKGEPKRSQGKCNYCGIFSHKEADYRKQKMMENTTSDKINLAKTSADSIEETVLLKTEYQDDHGKDMKIDLMFK